MRLNTSKVPSCCRGPFNTPRILDVQKTLEEVENNSMHWSKAASNERVSWAFSRMSRRAMNPTGPRPLVLIDTPHLGCGGTQFLSPTAVQSPELRGDGLTPGSPPQCMVQNHRKKLNYAGLELRPQTFSPHLALQGHYY